MRIAISLVLLLAAVANADVKLVHVPDGGVEPQAAIDGAGVIHLVYFKGDPQHGDLFYVTSKDGKTFSRAVKVNSEAESALVVGSVRGPQMALGKDGCVHVVWYGSSSAKTRGPGGATPLCYSRLGADGAFEPQRNLITKIVGLDGGGSIAADGVGHVYAVWHAPDPPGGNEQSRRVWLAQSDDDGKTFAAERKISFDNGACGCCALTVAAVAGRPPLVFYRIAKTPTQRDMSLLKLESDGASETMISPFKSGKCSLSTSVVLPVGERDYVLGYEENDSIRVKIVRPDAVTASTRLIEINAGPGKHPAIARNGDGELLVARAVGTGWNKGGTIAWQVFDGKGKPIAGQSGDAKNLPAWSYPAAVAKADGSFVIFY